MLSVKDIIINISIILHDKSYRLGTIHDAAAAKCDDNIASLGFGKISALNCCSCKRILAYLVIYRTLKSRIGQKLYCTVEKT